jgi:putative colanic acid biosynthesis acetyltransferase WcaF
VLVKHRVWIHWPWKLSIGDDAWIREGACSPNHEPITIGRNVCFSQDVFLCTGSNDRQSKTFEFDNGPIHVEDDAWLAASAVVLRGATVGPRATIGASALAVRDVSAGALILAPASQAVNRPARTNT